MDTLKSKVTFTALYSRLFIWALSVVANLIIPDHDAGVFAWTASPEMTSPTKCDVIVSYLTDGLTRWDGQYFLHIANNGYTYENTLAFFPLYPILLRATGEVIYWMQVDYELMHFVSCLKLAAILVNLACFVLAARALYNLSRRVLKDEYLAYKAALYFCLNPASIFFSAAYSEALHAYLSFQIMARVEKGFSFKLGLLLALSAATRSNSILNYGFVAYKSLKILHTELCIHQKFKEFQKSDLSTTIANILGDALVPAFFSAVVTVVPFGLFQWYGFTQYCSLTRPNLTFSQNIIDYAINNSLRLPSKEPSPWCNDHLPMAYSFVQSHYWGVGFLRYFTVTQIPNFMLAFPILFLVFKQSIYYFRRHKSFCLKLGLEFQQTNHVQPNVGDLYHLRVLSRECFVYIVHIFAITIFATFFMHVQVATRFLASSSPVIYWWISVLTTPKNRKPVPLVDHQKPGMRNGGGDKIEKESNLDSIWASVVIDERPFIPKSELWLQNFCVGYAVFGTILFSNFLPWT